VAPATRYSQSERDTSKYVDVPSFLVLRNNVNGLFLVFRFYTSFIDIAKEYPHAMELNVLVIGMPNVGKSTLLNALRNMGIRGR
jgi:ribosome biogenesis GTPase A